MTKQWSVILAAQYRLSGSQQPVIKAGASEWQPFQSRWRRGQVSGRSTQGQAAATRSTRLCSGQDLPEPPILATCSYHSSGFLELLEDRFHIIKVIFENEIGHFEEHKFITTRSKE